MSDRWTDKKRGYSGDGGVPSVAQRLSFLSKQREDLGGLDLLSTRTFDAEGNETGITRFGKYEKGYSIRKPQEQAEPPHDLIVTKIYFEKEASTDLEEDAILFVWDPRVNKLLIDKTFGTFDNIQIKVTTDGEMADDNNPKYKAWRSLRRDLTEELFEAPTPEAPTPYGHFSAHALYGKYYWLGGPGVYDAGCPLLVPDAEDIYTFDITVSDVPWDWWEDDPYFWYATFTSTRNSYSPWATSAIWGPLNYPYSFLSYVKLDGVDVVGFRSEFAMSRSGTGLSGKPAGGDFYTSSDIALYNEKFIGPWGEIGTFESTWDFTYNEHASGESSAPIKINQYMIPGWKKDSVWKNSQGYLTSNFFHVGKIVTYDIPNWPTADETYIISKEWFRVYMDGAYSNNTIVAACIVNYCAITKTEEWGDITSFPTTFLFRDYEIGDRVSLVHAQSIHKGSGVEGEDWTAERNSALEEQISKAIDDMYTLYSVPDKEIRKVKIAFEIVK